MISLRSVQFTARRQRHSSLRRPVLPPKPANRMVAPGSAYLGSGSGVVSAAVRRTVSFVPAPSAASSPLRSCSDVTKATSSTIKTINSESAIGQVRRAASDSLQTPRLSKRGQSEVVYIEDSDDEDVAESEVMEIEKWNASAVHPSNMESKAIEKRTVSDGDAAKKCSDLRYAFLQEKSRAGTFGAARWRKRQRTDEDAGLHSTANLTPAALALLAQTTIQAQVRMRRLGRSRVPAERGAGGLNIPSLASGTASTGAAAGLVRVVEGAAGWERVTSDAFLQALASATTNSKIENVQLVKSSDVTDVGLAHLSLCTNVTALALTYCER